MTDASSVLGSQLCDVVSVSAVQSALSLPDLQSAHPAGGKASTPGYESAHYNDDCSYGNYPDLAPPSGQANAESVRLGLHVSTDEEANFAIVANRAVTESERGPSENFKVGDLIGSTYQLTLAPDVDSSMTTRGVVTELPLNGNSYISVTVQDRHTHHPGERTRPNSVPAGDTFRVSGAA